MREISDRHFGFVLVTIATLLGPNTARASVMDYLWPVKMLDPSDESPSVKLLGNAYTQLQGVESTSGTISMGLAVTTSRIEARLLLSSGSVGSTLSAGKDSKKIGNFLLGPGSSATGAQASLEYYPARPTGWLAAVSSSSTFGFRVSVEAGKSDWTATPTGGVETTRSALGLALVAGPSLRWTAKGKANDIVVKLHPIQYSARILAGDAKDLAYRKAALGLERRWFDGAEIGAEIQVGSLYGSVALPYLPGSRPEQLTDGQLIVRIGLKDGAAL